MRRDKDERTAYALRRLSKAVDRAITAKSDQAKASARRWAELWAKAAGIKRQK
jgi:hypothetical protein